MRRGILFLFVVFAAVAIAAPDFASAGCGGGHRRQHGGDGSGDNGGDHHRRNHANPNTSGWDGQGRRGRRGRGGDGGVDVGVYSPTPGYGHGRIGPPTACGEILRLREDLSKLFQLRVQINSGKRVIVAQNGHQRVMSARNFRNGINEALASGNGTIDENTYGANGMHDMMNEAREQSLTAVDARISATQARAAELEYQCQE